MIRVKRRCPHFRSWRDRSQWEVDGYVGTAILLPFRYLKIVLLLAQEADDLAADSETGFLFLFFNLRTFFELFSHVFPRQTNSEAGIFGKYCRNDSRILFTSAVHKS